MEATSTLRVFLASGLPGVKLGGRQSVTAQEIGH